MENIPLERMFTGLWSTDFNDSFKFPSDDLRFPGARPLLSGFCLKLLYLEEISMSFGKSLLSTSVSSLNPYVDIRGDLLTGDGLP